MKRLHLIIFLLSAISARAAVFFSPVGITSANSTVYTTYALSNLYQGAGVGFEAAEPHKAPVTGGAGFNWVTIAPNPVADYYTAFPAPVLIIDLGQNRLLSEISIWGYSSGNTNGVKDFSLRFATDAEGPAGFGASIAYNPGFEALFDLTLRDSNSFSQNVTARYVEMTITDNWAGFQGTAAGGDRVGMGEIAFAAIPEPAAAVMAGLTGLLAFRRR
ncbi:MAG: hypothetical protein V4726_09620 [Verrucomicrobiota bacterium]